MAKSDLTGKAVAGRIEPDAIGVTLPHEHQPVDLSSCFTPPKVKPIRRPDAYDVITTANEDFSY